jgi:hypothetical protein
MQEGDSSIEFRLGLFGAGDGGQPCLRVAGVLLDLTLLPVRLIRRPSAGTEVQGDGTVCVPRPPIAAWKFAACHTRFSHARVRLRARGEPRGSHCTPGSA